MLQSSIQTISGKLAIHKWAVDEGQSQEILKYHNFDSEETLRKRKSFLSENQKR